MRTQWQWGSGLLIAGVAAGLLLGRLTGAPTSSAATGSSGPVGRYQLTVTGASTTWVYLTDTTTGRVWYQSNSGWVERSPTWAAPAK